MNSLVAYGSSEDENEDDIQPEKPAKIAKTEPSVIPSRPQIQDAKSDTLDTAPAAALKPIPSTRVEPETSVSASGRTMSPTTGPESGPAKDSKTSPANAPSPGPIAGPTAGPAAAPSAIPTEDASPPQSPYTLERQRLRDRTMPPVPDFTIPASPPPPPVRSEEAARLAATTQKFTRFLELKAQGVHFHPRLAQSAALRNPALLPKLLAFAGISATEAMASSLPPGLGVPVRWSEECYVESLVKQNERREKKRKLARRERVEFAPAARTEVGSGRGVEGKEGKRGGRAENR